MSKSAHLRIQDVRAILRLVGECRDLGDDPKAWQQHLLRTMARLAGATLATRSEMVGYRTPPLILSLSSWGWENGVNQETWQQNMDAWKDAPTFWLGWNRYADRLQREDGLALTRTDIISDQEWEGAVENQGIFRPAGLDHGMMCYQSLPVVRGVVSGVSLWRAAGEREVGPRDRALIREAYAAISQMLGGPLARPSEPSPADLAPRVRQVLRCLLEGDGDKQIAARLGLTRHTVNQYTKTVFQHFRVESRAELLARWVRRGHPARFSWEDER